MTQALKTIITMLCVLMSLWGCSRPPPPTIDHGLLPLNRSFAFQYSKPNDQDWYRFRVHRWNMAVQRGHRYVITVTPLVPISKSTSRINLNAWTLSQDPCENCDFAVSGDVHDSLSLKFVAQGDQMTLQTHDIPGIPCFVEIREIPM